ncbi:MAG: 6-phosphofructokinase, partial [Spirochaetota bacterium]
MITRDDTMINVLGERKYESPLRTSGFVNENKRVLVEIERDIILEQMQSTDDVLSFENAGPRKKLFFDPGSTSAAIVTCGGLCPGINNVIQGIARMLQFQYGVKRVLGVRYGFEGLVPEYRHDFVELTLDYVQDLHEKGGTVLGSSRGYQDEKIIVDTLVREKIDILFVIGGDGSLRGAHDIYREITKRELPISIVGVPKTIDNDIWFMDKTFGFSAAVSTATQSIYAAHTEA